MKYQENIHLSNTQLTMLNDLCEQYIYNYLEEDSNKNYNSKSKVLNESFINIFTDMFKKIREKLSERDCFYEIHSSTIQEKKENMKEVSRDKILYMNSNHIVKTDFYDLADFNRWEKIRTFEKTQ
tara:strand:+ start:452 stop:826 length:375 start_codon:yes stop_codon:yes gene_type:complete